MTVVVKSRILQASVLSFNSLLLLYYDSRVLVFLIITDRLIYNNYVNKGDNNVFRSIVCLCLGLIYRNKKGINIY